MNKQPEVLSPSERLDALEAKVDGALNRVAAEIKPGLAEVEMMLDDIEARSTKGHFSCPVRIRK